MSKQTKRLRPTTGGSSTLQRVLGSRAAVVALSAALVVGVGGTGAVAADLIGSEDIANGTIRATDLSDGLVTQLTGTSGPGANWGIVDREVRGNGDAYLRTGPSFFTQAGLRVSPPLGEGSLGLRTGSTSDQTAFGNQVLFFEDLVSGLTSLSFSVFTTSENNARGARNMPSIVVEIDPNLDGVGAGRSSMIFTPPNSTPDRWTAIDATNNALGRVWGLTGAAGSATGCQFQGSLCTWDRIQEVLEDGDGSPARIRGILVAKLRDQPFSGAVDALQVRGSLFDFEPLGVTATP